jgi:hypothetical protein
MLLKRLRKFFSSLGPWGQIMIVIHVTEPTYGLEGCPGEYHLPKVFFEEVGNDR